MKYVILTISLLATLTSPLQAQTVASAATGSGAMLFDTYVAETGLQAVDAATADNSTEVVAGLGNQLIVAAAKTATAGKSIAAADTVVRNTSTGELGILTGRVQIVSNNAALLQELTQRFALQPLKSLRGGKVQLLEAPAGTDLVNLLQQIRAVQGVQAARLDVLENINTPQ